MLSKTFNNEDFSTQTKIPILKPLHANGLFLYPLKNT